MIRHFNLSHPFQGLLSSDPLFPWLSLDVCRPPHFKHKPSERTLQRGCRVHTIEGQEGQVLCANLGRHFLLYGGQYVVF